MSGPLQLGTQREAAAPEGQAQQRASTGRSVSGFLSLSNCPSAPPCPVASCQGLGLLAALPRVALELIVGSLEEPRGMRGASKALRDAVDACNTRLVLRDGGPRTQRSGGSARAPQGLGQLLQALVARSPRLSELRMQRGCPMK